MSNSPLVDYTKLSPNCNSPRNQSIRKITVHHVAGIVSVETIGNIFAPTSRGASSNYGIGNDGRRGLYVNECDRAWTSGSASNDNQAITIEVSNCEIGGEWKVSDAAFNSLVELCVDICKRNGIEQLNWTGDASGNLTCHYMFQATACPGPYLKSKMPELAQLVNERLGTPTPAPTPSSEYSAGQEIQLNNANLYSSATSSRRAAVKSGTYFLWSGEVVNGRIRITTSPEKAGVNGQVTGWVNTSDLVTVSAPPSAPVEPAPAPALKSNEEIADEVIKGLWGNGADRKARLEAAGYNYAEVQSIVDRKLAPKVDNSIHNGNTVKFSLNATKWVTGQGIPGWVKLRTLFVRSEPSNGTCQVSTQKSGAITGVAYVKDLHKV